MLTACWAAPLCTCWAASTLPPVISAAASYMPSKTGLSGVPRPWPTPRVRRGAADRLEVGRVVHEGEQVVVGRRGPQHLDPVGGEHAEAVGQPHGQVEPHRVQRVVAAHRVAEQGVVPDDGDRVAHGPSSPLPPAARRARAGARCRTLPAGSRRPLARVAPSGVTGRTSRTPRRLAGDTEEYL